MKLDLYAAGYAVGQDKARKAGCAVVAIMEHPDGRVQRREMSFRLGNNTANLAALQAVRLALLAIRRPAKTTVVHSDNHYVRDMLAKEGAHYKAEPKVNAPVVAALREAASRVAPELVIEKFNSGAGLMCYLLAQGVAVKQANTDSGTQEVTNGSNAGVAGESRGSS